MVNLSVDQVRTSLERAVVGRRGEMDALLAAFLAGGHVILEGPPGTAKTLLVRALAKVSGCQFRRIQFTPDLMPADILGTNVFDAREGKFRTVTGPIFSDVVLADEINRAPAKTQAALLECMEEHTVTIDGVKHALSSVFTVCATMNPIEFEGTFPLPEAQLDRFLIKIPLAEISEDAEREVINRYANGFDPWKLTESELSPLWDAQKIQTLRDSVRSVIIEPSVQRYLVDIVRRTRTHPAVGFGASTRAAVALLAVTRARARMESRDFVIPDDVKFLAPFVLAHRLGLRPEAQIEGFDGARVVRDILEATPVPRAT